MIAPTIYMVTRYEDESLVVVDAGPYEMTTAEARGRALADAQPGAVFVVVKMSPVSVFCQDAVQA